VSEGIVTIDPHETRDTVDPAHPPDGQPQDELIMHLERDQFVAATSVPLPRAHLGARATAGLWALRIFVVLVSVMVIYTFIDQLH
jgi:hypothetical protein